MVLCKIAILSGGFTEILLPNSDPYARNVLRWRKRMRRCIRLGLPYNRNDLGFK
jgi:hypothetical protein